MFRTSSAKSGLRYLRLDSRFISNKSFECFLWKWSSLRYSLICFRPTVILQLPKPRLARAETQTLSWRPPFFHPSCINFATKNATCVNELLNSNVAQWHFPSTRSVQNKVALITMKRPMVPYQRFFDTAFCFLKKASWPMETWAILWTSNSKRLHGPLFSTDSAGAAFLTRPPCTLAVSQRAGIDMNWPNQARSWQKVSFDLGSFFWRQRRSACFILPRNR